VELGELALAQPALAEIVSMPSATVPDIGAFANTNKLLGTDGIDGIKTGTTDEAGACLLFSTDVTVGNTSITLVGVILGAPNHSVLDQGVLALLKSVTPGFSELTLATAGEPYATYSTEWGESAKAVAAKTATKVVWSDTPVSESVHAKSVAAGAKGAQVGSVEFTVGDDTITVPLELNSTLDAPDLWWRLTNPPWSR
jgi:D-alanyl-D-alanine carboxypeptidase (penicillin-binding protein 5/6)